MSPDGLRALLSMLAIFLLVSKLLNVIPDLEDTAIFHNQLVPVEIRVYFPPPLHFLCLPRN